MGDVILQFLLGVALGCGIWAYICVIINNKTINKLKKEVDELRKQNNKLEVQLIDFKAKLSCLASPLDIRLTKNHINRIEARIDRLAEIINGKRKVK